MAAKYLRSAKMTYIPDFLSLSCLFLKSFINSGSGPAGSLVDSSDPSSGTTIESEIQKIN